tara:strand:- start:10433 stop:10909 length:477 start_codon:yes stop_codon:yes gene_type:complete
MDTGNKPRTATLKTGAIVKGTGKLLTHDAANNTMDICADGEVAIGVSAGESSRSADGTYQLTAGATVSYYPLGGVLMVQSEISQTYTTGLLVYAGALGQCIDSNDHTSKVIGMYVGTGEASSALVANGNGDTEQTDAATLLLSEGTMIAVNTTGHVTA